MRAPRLISGAVTFLVAALFLAGGDAIAAPAATDRAADRTSAAGPPTFEVGVRISPQPPRVEVLKSSVVPRESVPSSVRPLLIYLRLSVSRRTRISVSILKTGTDRVVRRLDQEVSAKTRWYRLRWDGRTESGRLAAPGRYAVGVNAPKKSVQRAARFRLHGHVHPIAGPHGTRGAVGQFGAGRNGGRTHEGFDATARCGTPLVAVRPGRILKVANDPRLKGYYAVLKGEGERRTYLYAHLRRPATVRKGQRVRAGRRLGAVGQTGNAAGTPCHLHFEVRTRGRLLDPWPILNSWEW